METVTDKIDRSVVCITQIKVLKKAIVNNKQNDITFKKRKKINQYYCYHVYLKKLIQFLFLILKK